VKVLKIGCLTLLLVFLFCNTGICDKLIIPFDCYPKELQKKFAQTGRKLDLSGNDRTKDSWGFVTSEGMQFYIYTYKPATKEDFNIIRKIIFNKMNYEN